MELEDRIIEEKQVKSERVPIHLCFTLTGEYTCHKRPSNTELIGTSIFVTGVFAGLVWATDKAGCKF